MTARNSRTLLTVLGTIFVAGAIFAACGSGGSETAAPDATTTSAPSAATAEEASSEDTETPADQISFANEVQPILEANCVSCHSGTGPGTTHLVMETCRLYTSDAADE